MAIDNINTLLDSFMGINDSELAEQVRKLEYDNGIFAFVIMFAESFAVRMRSLMLCRPSRACTHSAKHDAITCIAYAAFA